MPQKNTPPVPQRAYTLRLRGTDPHDPSWREALWQTHDAVNKGAKAFGDWLLTLRGGLDHTLVDCKGKEGKRDPTDEERKTRRILLALSWLSVESKLGAQETCVVASGQDNSQDRTSKVIAALEGILKKRGVPKEGITEWKQDCLASLSAAIRDDAVWINRSRAFDEACGHQDKDQAREDAQTMLWFLLTSDYLRLPKKPKKPLATTGEQAEGEGSEDNASSEAITKSGRGAGQRTRHPYSHIFGRKTTHIFGNPPRTLHLRDHWRAHLKPLIEASGIPLRDPNTTTRRASLSPTELHREMFSKAAARLAQTWTKQKQQEGDREQRMAADTTLQTLENDKAYSEALQLLDTYCREREQATGSLEAYHINLRAIDGWDRLVAAWKTITETDSQKATEKRIAEAKRLQDEDGDKKFGDINLFTSLAATEYEPVWRHNEQEDPTILKTYVKGCKARDDAVRLKVAAFRHPDPCFHPIFCQFGDSRPPITYNRLEGDPHDDVRQVHMLLWTCDRAENVPLLAVSHRFDKEIGSVMDSRTNESTSPVEVTRRSRHGIAAANGPGESETSRVALVFDKKKVSSHKKTDDNSANHEAQKEEWKNPLWNGTLQANRRQLEAIGRMASTNPDKAEQAKAHLHWWLIVSLELKKKGPWYDFIEKASDEDQTAFTRTYKSGKNKGIQYISLDRWPYEQANATRKGHAKLILSRLPGLRVLSVDLGLRCAAACTVWETLSSREIKEACQAAGYKAPKESDLSLHLKKEVTKQKKGQQSVVKETTIYRRIGSDTLPDAKPHPAPWARLDRQFLIKLQGEEEGTREASNEEIEKLHQLEAALGRTLPIIDRLVKAGWGQSGKQQTRLDALRQRGWTPAKGAQDPDEAEEEECHKPSLSVDRLMSSAVSTMHDALKDHGDRARIAFAMTATYKSMPGDRRYFFIEAKELSAKDDKEKRTRQHIEFIQDSLILWYRLASSRKWRDDSAKQLWDDHIATMPEYEIIEERDAHTFGAERRKKQQETRDNLRAVAKALVENATLRKTLHDAWKMRWHKDDQWWKEQLRWLNDWILPRGEAAKNGAIFKVGGLSLTRLATLTEFRRTIQVGFFTRLTPDGRQMERDAKGQPTDTPLTMPEQFGQRAMDALDHGREQRVKQLASRIVEAALGIGRVRRHKEGKALKRPSGRVDELCHAIVIENLTHYRPKETRTRRENRQLMTWSTARIKKYLTEACELHGLHHREVSASYTSRQDSRTGAPGIRCQDVPVKRFMQGQFWRKQVAKAEQKQAKNRGDARERFLCELNALWKNKVSADWKKAGTVRIPHRGGEIFVSADPTSPAAKGLQADLNAAANIGLRALSDPDWPGKWWYVPCETGSYRPIKDRVSGSTAVNLKKELKKIDQTPSGDTRHNKQGQLGLEFPKTDQEQGDATAKGQKKRGKKGRGQSKEVVNLWRDISSSPLESIKGRGWEVYAAYQKKVQWRVVRHLLKEHNIPF